MSNDENANESEESSNKTEATVEAASNAAGNLLSKVMELKESNPKVFFGAIGGLVLVILIIVMSGGSSNKSLPVNRSVDVAVGQNYALKGVNTYDPKATIRIVSIPGSIAAYDDTTEGAGDKCKNLPQGSQVKALNVQTITGAKYVEIEILNGECAGRKGWVISNNLN